MTEEQFEWFMIVGGMCADGLKWVEAMALCRSTMEMPDDIYQWMIERKKAIQTKKSEMAAELIYVLIPRKRKKKSYDDFVLETIVNHISSAKSLLENGKREWKNYVEKFNTGGSDPRSDHQNETGRQKDRIPRKLSCKAKAKLTTRQTRRYKRLNYE